MAKKLYTINVVKHPALFIIEILTDLLISPKIQTIYRDAYL